MKKSPAKTLVKAFVLLLVPILAYYAIFIAFEPNNYFGLRKEALIDDIIGRLRSYEENPADNIIIGDSRLANFSMADTENYSGIRFENLSYGGASLTEQLDLLEWTMNKNPSLSTVVFGFSFYTVNKAYSHDRMVVQAMENPFVYMTNFGYNVNMLETFFISMHNLAAGDGEGFDGVEQAIPLGGGELESRDPATDEYQEYEDPLTGKPITLRTDLVRYANAQLGERTDNWSFNEEVFLRMLSLLAKCREQGIQVVVVMPVFHSSVQQLIIAPKGIQPIMQSAVARLREGGTTVLDYEFESPPAFGDREFYDGFHLDYYLGLPQWTQLVFTDVGKALEKHPADSP